MLQVSSKQPGPPAAGSLCALQSAADGGAQLAYAAPGAVVVAQLREGGGGAPQVLQLAAGPPADGLAWSGGGSLALSRGTAVELYAPVRPRGGDAHTLRLAGRLDVAPHTVTGA